MKNHLTVCDENLLLKKARNHLTLFSKVAGSNFQSLVQQVEKHTMLSMERLYDLHLAINYVNEAEVDGGILEVGTWKGAP